jgi:precorrin-8X/cobalt-precorrin-8 methylmutase
MLRGAQVNAESEPGIISDLVDHLVSHGRLPWPDMIFDRYIIVDWSASNRPRVGKDSVWVCVLGADGQASTENPPTRGKAEIIVRDAVRHFVANGERVLVGFDFPYGYPAGLAAALGLTGAPWLATWRYLAARLQDDSKTNASNRFQVAAGINARLEHHAFWGRPSSQPLDDLSARKDRVAYRPRGEEAGLAEWREAEALLRACGRRPHSAWKLFGNGSVGSQALTGIPVVSRLRHDPDVAGASAVWPFEITVPQLPARRGAVIHAEIWPSLIDVSEVTGQVKDETQVLCLAREFRDRDRAHALAGNFAAASPNSASEEGWILGVA